MRHQRIQTRTSGGARWWNLSLPVAITAVAVWATPAQARPGVGFGGGSGDAVGSLPS